MCRGIGRCTAGVCSIQQNPGNIDPAAQGTLTAGGSVDPAFKFLYPYDRTVFPRGLASPLLQFGGAGADAYYVHVALSGLDYKGFFGASTVTQVRLPDDVWTAITRAALPTDAVKVEVTRSSAGIASGPISETWTIAPGTLRGSIYYETVASAMLNGDIGIMRLRPGEKMPTILKSGCGNACHTASADGSTLVAAQQLGSSASYDLKNNAAELKQVPDSSFVYGGLYPDGSFLMSATNYRTWFAEPSRLYDTKTQAAIPAPGWDNVITNAGIPAFSPDGKKLTFNYEDKGQGHSLAMMDFDPTTKSFSNLVELTEDAAGFIGWPGFTPNNEAVVYHVGSNEMFETGAGEPGFVTGDLYSVDVASRKARRLDAANGYAASGESYLPGGEKSVTFVPTVLPIAVGGYFWVLYTSHRTYGNSLDALQGRGKLWVSALDISPAAGADASHPGFFLEGQELAATNLRAFWVLDPCRSTGTACDSGDQCCEGFCRTDGNGMACVPPPNGCANESERCATAADCCDTSQRCINGHCALKPPQ